MRRIATFTLYDSMTEKGGGVGKSKNKQQKTTKIQMIKRKKTKAKKAPQVSWNRRRENQVVPSDSQ